MRDICAAPLFYPAGAPTPVNFQSGLDKPVGKTDVCLKSVTVVVKQSHLHEFGAKYPLTDTSGHFYALEFFKQRGEWAGLMIASVRHAPP